MLIVPDKHLIRATLVLFANVEGANVLADNSADLSGADLESGRIAHGRADSYLQKRDENTKLFAEGNEANISPTGRTDSEE